MERQKQIGSSGPQTPAVLWRRFPLSCLAAIAFVAVSVALFPGWRLASFRFGSAVAWFAGLAVLWFGASPTDQRERISREPVGPPLSAEAERVALAAVFIIALAFRFVLLADVPPFVSNDESMFGFEASWRPEHSDLFGLSLLQSWPRGWFPHLFGFGWNGFPTLSFALHWLPVTVLGVSNWSLRVGCGIVGVVSILVLYRWARRWWGNAVALCAAMALSLNIEHVYWSRIALNNIDAALVGVWALAALAWALDTRSGRAWVTLGFALGFGCYSYHGAKLHLVLAAVVLLVLVVSRLERLSWSDGYGFLTAALAAALVVAPLTPEAIKHWAALYGHHEKQLDLPVLISALSRGDASAAQNYVSAHLAETVQLFRPAPVMRLLFLLGTAVALWQWRDPRYLTVVLWMVGILFIGSATVGWRSARLIGAAPVISLMPALLIGHIRAVLWRSSSSAIRWVVSVGAVGLLMVVLYESWWVEFLWRTRFPNVTYGVCRLIRRVPLPATFYVAGKGDPFTPEEAAHVCSIPDDPRRRFVTIPLQTSAPPEIGDDPNVLAIVYADRSDFLEVLRQQYPQAVDEPYLVNGPDPFSGFVPGSANEHGLVLHVIRLRSSCPGTPLLQTHGPC